MNIIFTTN